MIEIDELSEGKTVAVLMDGKPIDKVIIRKIITNDEVPKKEIKIESLHFEPGETKKFFLIEGSATKWLIYNPDGRTFSERGPIYSFDYAR
jgi:hypothetical protein